MITNPTNHFMTDDNIGLLRNTENRIESTAEKLYQYYNSQGGVTFEGIAKGGLGVITSVMSKDSDESMLGYHLGLGIIWTALTAKHFISAGRGYSSLLPKSIEEAGIEMSAYAKLCAAELELSGSSISDEEFTKKTNAEICKTISAVLAGKKSTLSEEEQRKIEANGGEEVKKSLQSRTQISATDPLVLATGISALVAVVSAVTIPFVEDRTAPIATAALSSFATSVLGSTLENSFRNLNELTNNSVAALKNLNERKVHEIKDSYREDIDLEELRTTIRKEEYQKKQQEKMQKSQSSTPANSPANPSALNAQNPLELPSGLELV